MLTVEGCKQRISNLLGVLEPASTLLLADPIHLRYLANADQDPFSLGAEFGAFLAIRPDGHTTLIHDSRVSKTIDAAFADERIVLKWYDGQTPGAGSRRMIVAETLRRFSPDGRIHDMILDPQAGRIQAATTQLRRNKLPDELATMKQCMSVTEAGHAWARQNVRAGMTELDVYAGILAECTKAAGHAVIVYGDFAVSPGAKKHGGPPSRKALQTGETLILDFSVVIRGYRSDFTNTLVVGDQPTPAQQELLDLCLAAMQAGEAQLRSGVMCQQVYDAVRGVFDAAGKGDAFPHHAGHGIGLTHPEAPFLVKHSREQLIGGDVVTLEPGLYIDGIGGVRIERNYHILPGGSECLSHHTISLT